MTQRIAVFFLLSAVCIGLGFLPLGSQESKEVEDFDSLFKELQTDTDSSGKDKEETKKKEETNIEGIDFEEIDATSETTSKTSEKEKKSVASDDLTFEDVSFDDLEFIETDGVKNKMFDEEFRAEAATCGFLANYANTRLSLIDIPFGTPLSDTYRILVKGFAEKGYYDLSSFREDDVVARDVFCEFIFSILKKKEGLSESDYPDKTAWAVTRGFLSSTGKEDLFILPGFEDEKETRKKDVPLIKKEEGLFEDDESEPAEVPDVIHPNRVAGTVDVESNITVKFVTPFFNVGSYRILQKDSAEGTYKEVGKASGTETTFVDRNSLSSHKVGRTIVQYQISRTEEDFIVNITYREPSGITTTKKIFYRIEPVKESVTKERKKPEKEEAVLPEFLSGKVDFTGNIFIRWIEEEEAKNKYNIYWKKGFGGTYQLVKESVSGTEFSDNINRVEDDIKSVQEYQISRTLDNFIMNITYTNASGAKKNVKYFYKVSRKGPGVKDKDADLPSNYVTRGEVIDAFAEIERDIPRLRRKLVELPVFSPIHTLPASPI